MAMSVVVDMAKARARRAQRLPSKRTNTALESAPLQPSAQLPNKETHSGAAQAPNRTAYYEQQAAEVRGKAELMVNEEVRNAMLQLAKVWESMAQKAKMDRPSVRPRSSQESGSSARTTLNALRTRTVLSFSCLLVQFHCLFGTLSSFPSFA
jgi:hypothetical protein